MGTDNQTQFSGTLLYPFGLLRLQKIFNKNLPKYGRMQQKLFKVNKGPLKYMNMYAIVHKPTYCTFCTLYIHMYIHVHTHQKLNVHVPVQYAQYSRYNYFYMYLGPLSTYPKNSCCQQMQVQSTVRPSCKFFIFWVPSLEQEES